MMVWRMDIYLCNDFVLSPDNRTLPKPLEKSLRAGVIGSIDDFRCPVHCLVIVWKRIAPCAQQEL